MLVRHGVVVESGSLVSLTGRYSQESLSLGAQVLVDFGVFVVLLVGHLVSDIGVEYFWVGGVGGAPSKWLEIAFDLRVQAGTCFCQDP